MSRYSRSSDDGIGDQKFHKKRRLLHDVSASNESLCQFRKANANWNEVLDKSDRRISSGEMRKYSSGGSDISRSSNTLRRNNYSESHIATPGSSFFCNSDGDSESITSSFKTRPKFHKRETVLQDDFKTALSRDVTLAQDPSFGLGLESNRSCFIADNSGNFASDNSVDNACGLRGVRMKYCRRKLKQHSPKERKDFANILNDVTASEHQGRIVEDNVNEVTNVNLNEVSHFKSNETGFGAQSAITYSTQIVTQTGQFGGMSYVTISEVKERVIIPGRSCPRPMKKERRENTPSEVNYNDNIDNDYGNAYVKSPNSVAEMGIHEEDVAENQSEILSDFEVESDILNRSGPRPQYYSPLKHTRQVKQSKTKYVVSKDLYAEMYEDDSMFNSDVNIVSSLSMAEMDDSNAYNSTLRSHKAMQKRRNARLSRSKNESYVSSFNDVSGRSNSRRSILREISQNEFELRSVDEDIQCNDHEVSRYRKVSENSEELFLNAMDSVKKVHDNVIEERIKKDMSTEVRKMAKKCKESYVERNADSDVNFMQELDSVPMIKERRQKRKNRSKVRVQNEFDTVYRDFSISDSIVSVPCAEDRIGLTQMERISSAEKKASESHDIYRKSRSIAELEEDVQNSVVLPLNGSKNISMEECENDGKPEMEENLVVNVEKLKRRNSRRKQNGSKEFNLTIENASLSSTAESPSSQSSPLFMYENKAVASNSTNDDKIIVVEDVTSELALKDKPCSGKMKGNYSKSTLIVDQDTEDYSLHLDQPRSRRRRNPQKVKPIDAEEFNVNLEDVSSNVEESISSTVGVSHQLEMGQKSLVSADEIQDADADPLKISEQRAIESTLTMKKKISGNTKRSFDQSSSISDDFRVEGDSPVMDIIRPKRRSKQLLSEKGDTFNIHSEEVSAEESFSLVAEASHQPQKASKSSISMSSEIPDTADKHENASKQEIEVDSSAIDQQVIDKIDMTIDKSIIIPDANLRSATNYPAINIAKERRVCNELQPLKGNDNDVHEESISSVAEAIHRSIVTQEFAVPQNAVSSSKNAELVTSESDVILQSRVTQQSAGLLPESSFGSGNYTKKSTKAIPLVSTEKTSMADAKLDNMSKQETTDDAPPIDQQANDETKQNISKSRVIADKEKSLDVSSPLNIKSHRRKFQRKSVNGNEFNIVMEDLSLSNAADSMTSIAETSQSEKSAKIKKKEPGSIVESEDPSRHKTEEVAPAIDQGENNETERNISKSRVAADEEMILDVNSPLLNAKGRKRKNQRKSVNVNEFNIAMEGLSSSIAADSINSIAEISHSEKSAEDKIPACPSELEDIPRHKADDGIPAVGQEVNDETKGNVSKSRFILDEELSMDSAVMIVGRRKRRKNKGKSVQSEAFHIAMEGVSSSTASDSILPEAEACCELVMPQNSSEHSHPLLDGCLPDLKKTNVTLQTLVDGKVAPVQSDRMNENNHNPPQIECTLDNSLSLSKISNVLGNDVAESTRGFINSKWLISEYFGDVSGITDDALNAVGGCAISVVSARNKSKKSLDSIVNKVETLELPHEALRCKSGGENFSLEGFRNFSLEKQSLDSPERIKSSEHSVSSSSNSKVGKCDVDLIIEEADIAAEEVTEKGELIEVPTEIPSKSELSMSLKSSIHNMEEKIMVSCIADAENLREDASDSRVPMENIEGEQPQKSIDGCDGNSGDNRCSDAKQNENLPAKETTDEEGVGKLKRSPGHSDIEESNVCPSAAVTLISEQVAPHTSTHKSTQVEIAAESVENGLTEKVVESPCNLVNDHAAIVKDTCSNQNPEKIADDETSSISNGDAPIPNSTNLISETVEMAPEKILIVQPPPKEPTSCTSSTADKADKLHQTLFHDQSFSKSKDVLTDEVLLMQNSHLEIKSSVEQEGKTYKQIPNSGSSNEEIITRSCQPNPTLAPERVSKLPVPIKPKGSLTSKSTPLLKYPPTSSKLVLHASPEEEELPRKLGVLKPIDEETFTILPSKKSSDEHDKLFDEIIKDPCESSHLKVLASDLHDDVHKVSRTVDSENLNAAEHTEVPVTRNTESGKLNLSLSFVCLETQGKATTTINELTFIKTAAPGMTSTPLPSMQGFENRRNTEDVSMLSEISELTLDQIATQEQKLDPVTKGNFSVIESSPAINELTFIKSTCLKPPNEEEASQVLCDEEQNKDITDSKKSVSITEAADSSIGKAREITNNSAGANDLRSSLINLVPCSVEPEVEQEEEKGIQPAQELTFTISSALAMSSTSKGIGLDSNEGGKVVCVSESVNGIVKSSNSALPAVNNESSEEMVNGTPSELAEVNSGGNVMAVTKPEVHLSVAKSNVQSNVTVADSNISSVNKLLQDATNICNPSENDIVSNDTQKPVPHSIVCVKPPGSAQTNSKSTSPKTNETLNKQPEQSDIFNELLLLSPLSTSRWNAICHTSDCLTSMISSEVGDSEKITSTGNERFSDPKCTVKSPFKESEVHNSRSAGIARDHTSNSSGLPYLREADVSHLRVSRAKSFELNDPKPSYFSDSDIEFRSTEIEGQKIGTSDCLRNTEGSHLRLSAAVGSKYMHSRPSSSILSERSSLRPSTSTPSGWSSITLSSAKESDGDVTRPGPSSHTSEESSAPDPIESLSTPLRTRYRYFSTPKTVERKAVYEVIDRIDASAMKRKKQRDLIFDTIFPKVVPASKEFKKPRIPPKPKKVQVEDFDEDEDKEMNHPVKKRRLPVWARNELKTIVTEAIEEQDDHLLDPQEFLLDLVDTIKLVTKSKRLKEVRLGVQKVKQELFNLKLVRTLRDFYQFVRDYLPYEFRRRSIPSSENYKFNPVWEIEADLDCSLFSSVEGIPNVYHE